MSQWCSDHSNHYWAGMSTGRGRGRTDNPCRQWTLDVFVSGSLEQRGHTGDQGFGLIKNLQQVEVNLEHHGADMMIDRFDPTPSLYPEAQSICGYLSELVIRKERVSAWLLGSCNDRDGVYWVTQLASRPGVSLAASGMAVVKLTNNPTVTCKPGLLLDIGPGNDLCLHSRCTCPHVGNAIVPLGSDVFNPAAWVSPGAQKAGIRKCIGERLMECWEQTALWPPASVGLMLCWLRAALIPTANFWPLLPMS